MDKNNLPSTTEQKNENSKQIDIVSTNEICLIINNEDKKVALAVEQAVSDISAAIDLMFERFQKNGRLIYVGAGCSGRLGIVDASEMEPTFSIDRSKVIGLIAGGSQAFQTPIEGAEDDEAAAINDLKNLQLSKDDIVLGIAASGVTPYVLSALKYSQKIGALAIGLCMSEYELMHPYVDKIIKVITGPEVINGSTRLKAGTATKLVLNMISTTLMIKLGRVYQNYMIDVKATNHKLKKRCLKMVMEITQASYEKCLLALEQTDYECKTAIVMIIKHLDYASSKLLLQTHDYNLHRIIL